MLHNFVIIKVRTCASKINIPKIREHSVYISNQSSFTARTVITTDLLLIIKNRKSFEIQN